MSGLLVILLAKLSKDSIHFGHIATQPIIYILDGHLNKQNMLSNDYIINDSQAFRLHFNSLNACEDGY